MADDKQAGGLPDLSSLRIDPGVRNVVQRGRRKRFVLAGVLIVMLVLLGMFFLGSQSVQVEVAPAKNPAREKGEVVLNASGYVTPRRRSTVAAKITGRVQEMLVEEGMHVAEGQVLARIDDADARKVLDTARADYDVGRAAVSELEVNYADAMRTLRRIIRLQSEGVSSQQDLDSTQAAADALKARIALAMEQVRAGAARLEVARQDVENCTIRAPFSGIAVSKDAQVGEMVSPISAGGGFTRTGIATIVDMESLEIEVDVNESYIAKVEIGQAVEAVLDAYPGWQIPCTVRTIIPTADRQKATVKVRIGFAQLDPRILPDMGVKVSFLSGGDTAPKSGVRALIPGQAVRETGNQPVVFLYQGGRLAMRGVTVGEKRVSEVEILEGVSPGDTVVVSDLSRLRDGQRAALKE
jgi:RND family efflux transporter MFP subunit